MTNTKEPEKKIKKITIDENKNYYVFEKDFQGIILYLNRLKSFGRKVVVVDEPDVSFQEIALNTHDFCQLINLNAVQLPVEATNTVKSKQEKPIKQEVNITAEQIQSEFMKFALGKKEITLKEFYEKYENKGHDKKQLYKIFHQAIEHLNNYKIVNKFKNGVYHISNS